MSLTATSTPGAEKEEEFRKLVLEQAKDVEEVDMEKFQAMLDDLISSNEIDFLPMAEEEPITTQASMRMNNCEWATFELVVDIFGLIMAIIGLPSHISKRAAKKLAKKAGKKLNSRFRKIAKEHFRNTTDLMSIATGVWEFLKAIGELLSPSAIINTIFGSMSFWEKVSWGVLVSSQILLLFATNIGYIVAKMAMVAPSIAEVVASTANIIDKCD